ncbi:hypothetical protein ACFL1H_02195 [Nanoarchaeota archaeon]
MVECIVCKKVLEKEDDEENEICQSCKSFYKWARKKKKWDKKRNGLSVLSWLKKNKEVKR